MGQRIKCHLKIFLEIAVRVSNRESGPNVSMSIHCIWIWIMINHDPLEPRAISVPPDSNLTTNNLSSRILLFFIGKPPFLESQRWNLGNIWISFIPIR